MPMYTYKCSKCDAPATDYLVKISDPIPACRVCGSVHQEKQLATNTGHCLMGYGWHKPGMSTKRVGS
jgi:putative FmdB family regulatory protein